MLKEFSFENIYSFKDKQSLDMLFQGRISSSFKEDHIINLGRDKRFLKTGIVYGKNANGKSNIIKTIKFLKDFVLNINIRSDLKNLEILEEVTYLNNDEPIKLSLEIFLEKYYRYEVILKKNYIYERLDLKAPTGKEFKNLFSAEIIGNEIINITHKDNSLSKENLNSFSESSLSALAFLATHIGNPDIKKMYEYFRKNLIILEKSEEVLQKNESLSIENIRKVAKDEKLKSEILEILKMSDPLITDLELDESSPLSKTIIHREYEEKKFSVKLSNDSHGVKNLFSMIFYLYQAFGNELITLFIDEFDATFNIVLIKKILGFIYRETTNTQLIYTSHDIVLMSQKNFLKEEIFIVDKIGFSSTLYSLGDFEDLRYDGEEFFKIFQRGELYVLEEE